MTAQLPILPGSTDTWLDISKTFIGALAGALAAFGFNLWLQKRSKRLDEIAAGNFAMATLTRQYNGFLNVRRTIGEELERCRVEAPRVPRWFIFRPIIHFLPDELEFDFESLTFLFEEGHPEFFQKLHIVETLQRDLIGYLGRLNEGAVRKQEKFEAAGFIHDDQEMTTRRAREIAGPRLALELDSVIAELETHCANDGPEYLKAADLLYRALSKRFGLGIKVVKLVGPITP